MTRPIAMQVRDRASTKFSELTAVIDGEVVEVQGWIAPFSVQAEADYFALVEDPSCCLDCLPTDATRRIEVFAKVPLAITGSRIRLRGKRGLKALLPVDDRMSTIG